MHGRIFPLLLLLTAAALAQADEPTCEASVGECIITGYYDYDPLVTEINLLVEPANGTGLISEISLPSGVSAGQAWPAAHAPATCQISKACPGGGLMQCEASAPCSGGEAQASVWCGTLGPDALYGKVYLCAGHQNPGGPGLKKGQPNPPGPGGGGPPPPGPNPPGPGPAAGSCTQTLFVDNNINNLGKYLMQIEDRTPTRNKQFTVLDRGGHISHTTIVNDGKIIDTTNSVHADTTEIRRFRKQNNTAMIALDGIGWLGVNPMMAAALGGAAQMGTPAQFAVHLPWDRHTGRLRCPRSRSNQPDDACLVFNSTEGANFYVHAKTCTLETVAMRNKNGPVLAQIYHLFDSFTLSPEVPVRQLSVNPFGDQEAHRKLAEGKGIPSLYHSLSTPGQGIAPR